MPKYLDAAEKICQRSKMSGLAYCKGLYLRYTNLPAQALKELNVARYDNLYGPLATATMIDIYLNPANEMVFTNIEDQKESHHTTLENISIAKVLIQELANKGIDTTILECNALLSTRENAQLD